MTVHEQELVQPDKSGPTHGPPMPPADMPTGTLVDCFRPLADGWTEPDLLAEVRAHSRDLSPSCEVASEEVNALILLEAFKAAAHDPDDVDEGTIASLSTVSKRLHERDPNYWANSRHARPSGSRSELRGVVRRCMTVLLSDRTMGVRTRVALTVARPRSAVRAPRGHCVGARRRSCNRAGPDDPGEGEPDPEPWIGRDGEDEVTDLASPPWVTLPGGTRRGSRS